MNKPVYLDYAATTPVDPEVILAMKPYWNETFANPGAIHRCGQDAIASLDASRETMRKFLGAASSSEIIFTGSATEANNLAIFGVIHSQGSTLDLETKIEPWRPHVITTAIEHVSVLEPIRTLERVGAIEATILNVDEEGLVTPEKVAEAVREQTALVSIGYANNEIGTIQPTADIARAVKAKNPRTFVHADAAQAAMFLDMDVRRLGVDLMTVSAHKMYGPKGIGALYVKDGTALEPILYGGGQEYGLRSGTENVPLAAGFAKAAEIAMQWKSNPQNSEAMRAICWAAFDGILRAAPGAARNGPEKNRLPNNINIFIPNADPETFLIALSEEGICVSSGSACSARAQKRSHVIEALGRADKAGCHLRVTIGKATTPDDINVLIKAIKKRLAYALP